MICHASEARFYSENRRVAVEAQRDRSAAFRDRAVNLCVRHDDVELHRLIKSVGGRWNNESKNWQILPEDREDLEAVVAPLREQRAADDSRAALEAERLKKLSGAERIREQELREQSEAILRQKRYEAGERDFSFYVKGEIYESNNSVDVRAGGVYELKGEVVFVESVTVEKSREISQFDEEWRSYERQIVKGRIATDEERQRFTLREAGFSEETIEQAQQHDIDPSILGSLVDGAEG